MNIVTIHHHNNCSNRELERETSSTVHHSHYTYYLIESDRKKTPGGEEKRGGRTEDTLSPQKGEGKKVEKSPRVGSRRPTQSRTNTFLRLTFLASSLKFILTD